MLIVYFLLFSVAGRAIERVCAGADGTGMVSAARALLAAVTRVLLLADMVVVRQLLLAKDKVTTVTMVTTLYTV